MPNQRNPLDDNTWPAVSGVDGFAVDTTYPRPRPSYDDIGASGTDPKIDFSDAASGDTLFAAVFIDHDAGSETITTPSGWTLVAGAKGANDVRYAVFTKTAGASEGATTFVTSYSGDSIALGWILDGGLNMTLGAIELVETSEATSSTNILTTDPANRTTTTSDGWICYTAAYLSQDSSIPFSDAADQQPSENDIDWSTHVLEWNALDDTVEPTDIQWSGFDDSNRGLRYDKDSGNLRIEGISTQSGGNMGLALFEAWSGNPRAVDNPMTWQVYGETSTDAMALHIYVNVSLDTDEVSRFATEVGAEPDPDAEISRFAIYAATVPYATGTSVISMLLPNPDQIETSSRLNEVRQPDIPSAIRGIKVKGVTGELVRSWEIFVDMSDVYNVSNVRVEPDEAFDSLTALKEQELIVNFSDLTGSVWRDEEDETNVKIMELTRIAVGGKQYAQMRVVEVYDA